MLGNVAPSYPPDQEGKQLIQLQSLCVCVCVCVLSLQSCLTLCNPMGCNPPGSSVHGDSPGKKSGVGFHALLQGVFLIQGSKLQADSLPLSYLGSPITVPRQIFCFLLTVSCSTNYLRYSILHYKKGFLFDNFAHLLTNVSILSMFNVG